MSTELQPRPKFAPSPAARRKKRDFAVSRLCRRLRRDASYLDEARYAPLLRDFCQLTLLIEKSYSRIRDLELTDDPDHRNSLETLRRMYDSHRALARELGLSPTVAQSLTPRAKILDLDALRNVTEEE